MHKGDQGYLDGLKQNTAAIPTEYGKVTQAVTEAKQPIDYRVLFNMLFQIVLFRMRLNDIETVQSHIAEHPDVLSGRS